MLTNGSFDFHFLSICLRAEQLPLLEVANVLVLVAHTTQLSLVVLLKVGASTEEHIVKTTDLLDVFNDAMVHHIVLKRLLSTECLLLLLRRF